MADGETESINPNSLSICWYAIPYRFFHQTSRVGDLMVGFILRDISLQNDGNASASVIPRVVLPVSTVVVEGVARSHCAGRIRK